MSVKQPTWEGYQADVAKPNSKTKSNFTGFIRYLTEFNSKFYACGQAMGGFDTSGITDGIPVDPYDDFCKADIIDNKSILLAQEVSASLKGVKQTSTGDTCVITKPNIESTVVINTDKMTIVNMNKKNFMTVHGDGDGCKTKKAGEFSSADKFMETLFEKKTDIDYIGGDLNLTTLKTGLEPDAIGILINNYLDDLILLIEYDGEFHYKALMGSTLKEKQKNLEDCQRRDKIKNKWAEENNIPLLRIPYWDFDRIEELIEAFILEHTSPKERKQLALEI